jgi:excisionase family DNA binding protein
MTTRLATLEEVAAYLQVPVKTLYAWRGRHEGPPGFKVGRHVRFRWTDVDSWLASRADQIRDPRQAGGRTGGLDVVALTTRQGTLPSGADRREDRSA